MIRPHRARRRWYTIVAFAYAAVVSACGGNEPHTQALTGVGEQWIRAWSGRQHREVLALYDEDVTFRWPTLKKPLRGKSEVAKYLQVLWSSWSQMELSSSTIFVDEGAGRVAIDWTMTAYDAQTANPIQLQGVEILQIRNGIITFDRGVFDGCSLLAQARATPPSGTPVPRTPVVSTH